MVNFSLVSVPLNIKILDNNKYINQLTNINSNNYGHIYRTLIQENRQNFDFKYHSTPIIAIVENNHVLAEAPIVLPEYDLLTKLILTAKLNKNLSSSKPTGKKTKL